MSRPQTLAAAKTLRQYLSNIDDLRLSGSASEQTYRAAFHECLRQFLPAHARLIHEASRAAVNIGVPDFIVQHKTSGGVIACVETKQIGDTDLHGKNKNKEQFERYKSGIPNCLFTDYLNFVFYSDGATEEIRLAELSADPAAARLTPLPQNVDRFLARLEIFLSAQAQPITNAQKLAERMAGIARMLARAVLEILRDPKQTARPRRPEDNAVIAQMQAFNDVLFANITAEDFADAYAQTIAYGMLAARVNYGQKMQPFTRIAAGAHIPKTNPFIRRFFNHNTGHDIHPQTEWLVDNIAALFAQSDTEAILSEYGERRRAENPLIHFYETFLSCYNKAQRKQYGVWYTPDAAVRFIVDATDALLKKEFNLPHGLADSSKIKIAPPQNGSGNGRAGKSSASREVHKVQILDPAAGTGTFMAEIIRHIHGRFEGQQGRWNSYVENHLLPRLLGFELLVASYAMAHLQLDLRLKQTGYAADVPARFRVYMTNSLEDYHPSGATLFHDWLSEEAKEADRIKRDVPIMCVIGNPPYKGESSNRGQWIMDMLEDYKKEPGGAATLQEQKKWLNDDYVKFMRYGQYLVEKNQSGILAFINAHGFLDNPTFHGMRWNLLRTYDKIYILNLHGNSNRQETAPDGGKDENIFTIKQGVSINLCVKTGRKNPDALGRVYYADCYGTREEKLNFLMKKSLATAGYKKLPNVAPRFLMVPMDYSLLPEYEQGFSLHDLFSLSSVGIVTARDNFTLHHTKEEVINVIDTFLSLSDEQARAHFNLGKDKRDWQVKYARADLQEYYPGKGYLCKVSVQPFDNRWTFYTGKSKGFHCMPRGNVMRHFIAGNNVGLSFQKGEQGSVKWSHVHVTQFMTEHGFTSSTTTNYQAPLYRVPNGDELENNGRAPNLNMDIVGKIAADLSLTFTPEKTRRRNTFAPIDLLDYCYAVLHSPAYRQRFNEFLKTDFPRVPYPQNAKEFWRLAGLGAKLRELHLMQANITPQTTYPLAGNNIVDKIQHKDGKVYINKTQYVGNVPAAAWEFYIGGYQPAQKWLKDRKGKALGSDDLEHYQKILTTLAATAPLMQTIDSQ